MDQVDRLVTNGKEAEYKSAADGVETPVDHVEKPDVRVESAADGVETPADHVEKLDVRVESAADRVETPDDRVETPDVRVESAADRVDSPDVRVETPDVYALKIEDALALILRDGAKIGRVEFSLPPRRFSEAEELGAAYTVAAEQNRILEFINASPDRKYRVLRCVAEKRGEPGGRVYNLLLTEGYG